MTSRDPAALAASILPWLHTRMPQAGSIDLPPPRSPDVGASSDTWFIEPVIREAGEPRQERWVLRIEPTDFRVYKDAAVERQYRVMARLHETGAVPVPRAFWYEADRSILGAPFFLMERVEGETLPSRHHREGLLARSAPKDREAIWLSAIETLAKIHRVADPRLDFLARPELGPTGLDQEIAYWFDYLRWTGAPVREVQERAQRWLSDHAPRARGGGLAWGDARLGNMIFRANTCQAVIDWETVSWGGAETDLGWWLFYEWYGAEGTGAPRLEGLGDRAATVAAWESFAGRKAEALDWHEVFAMWRFGAIVDRARLLAGQLGRGPVAPLKATQIIDQRLESLIAG